MRILKRLWWGSIIVALIAVGITCKANAQTPDSEYFWQTDQWVRGEFLSTYRSLPDPLLILGYPITAEQQDPTTGMTVQYFQLGRLELNPNAQNGKRVTISNLGWVMYTSGAPLVGISTDSPTCRYFPKNQVSVCYAFLQFFERYGGVAVFGEPISSLEWRDQRMVQYFENARMEWRPEAQEGKRVGLTHLGRLYHDRVLGMAASQNESAIGAGDAPKPKPPAATQLKVRAFVKNALLAPNSSQTLYVIVQDQGLRSVQGAVISVVVTDANGRVSYYRPEATNQDGITIFSFNSEQSEAQQIVRVDVTATYGQLEQQTNTWYRIWW